MFEWLLGCVLGVVVFFVALMANRRWEENIRKDERLRIAERLMSGDWKAYLIHYHPTDDDHPKAE